MNTERSRFVNLASQAPTGLEISGPKRQNIYSKFKQLRLEWLATASMIGAAACGGGTEANATVSNTDKTPVPVATGEKIAEITTPTVVTTPEVKVATSAVTGTEAPRVIGTTPEAKKIDSQAFWDSLNGLSLVPEQNRVEFKRIFFEQDLPKAQEVKGTGITAQFQQSEPYQHLYSLIRGFYMSVRQDPAKEPMVRADLAKVEQHIKSNWPVLHEGLTKNGAFTLPEIK